MSENTYEDGVVYLSDLIDRDKPEMKLEGYVFRNCTIRGPIVLLPSSLFMSGCIFAAPDVASMFFEIPDGPRVGVLAIDGFTFEGCTIEHVGWAGGEHLRNMLAGGTSPY